MHMKGYVAGTFGFGRLAQTAGKHANYVSGGAGGEYSNLLYF